MVQAVTRLPSGDGQFWDIQDTSWWSQDSGGIATGGAANPFNGFGYLKLRGRGYLRGFGLAHDGSERFDSLTPLVAGDLVVARGVFAPRDANYLRYLDSYTNISDREVTIDVAWGGAAGAYEDGGLTTIAATSTGDRAIDPADSFVVVMQNAHRVTDPVHGPSGHGPSAHVLGTNRSVRKGVGDMYGDPFADPYPGFDPAHIGYVFSLRIPAHETQSLMTFVVKGLSETYDPRGGAPVTFTDALVAPKHRAPYTGADAKIPAAGSQIAYVTEVAKKLVADPDLRGLTPSERAEIVNWQAGARHVPGTQAFTVVEKTASQLQDAMTRGETTSADIVREYLRRLAVHADLRSMLVLNPRAVADARALDAERGGGRVRGPLHGIPIAFKDNIDVLGLATTGGSQALVEHRPRLDSKMAAGMRRAGAVVLGKANLDEFPFGDFGISTVAGTIGNAYDPTLSVAGSSGGSATAVTSSFVTIAFGTDTCNSLSNPASFASLTTIRTTRGLTSRAGVMPLNTYNDAVGPIAKSVRELALVLDQVAGSDPEDPVTKDADAHKPPSFGSTLDANALRGARIGVVPQLYVGVTGEREAAGIMDSVVRELRAAGATVIDVTIPSLDAEYRSARGSAPGSLKAGWTAYLTRGAKSGDKVFTIEELLASGKLAPDSASRFEDALRPTPTGAELQRATDAFYSARDRFRELFVRAMDEQRLDALVYPANQARPHAHEGGLERYGGEPGTCEESAMTGLPQVSVPAGFLGGKYPFGVSILGRSWADAKILSLAYAYEQATHHRRPPPLAR
jgi:amidase